MISGPDARTGTVGSAFNHFEGLSRTSSAAIPSAKTVTLMVRISLRFSAAIRPTTAPASSGTESRSAGFHGIWRAWWNFHTATAQPSRTGTRLVALATMGCRPRAIITGRVTAVPLDATVLRKPAATPAASSSRAVLGSMP